MMQYNSLFKKIFLGTMLATSIALVGCGSDDNDDSYVFKPDEPKYELYVKHQPYKGGDVPAYATSIDVMSYKMPYVNGKTQEATAMVMVPKTATQPKDGWRVVVWAHGTTGVGDSCAPSNNPLGKNFGILANSLLDQGYIILAPDYEGLGTTGIHPYLNLASESQSAIYAVKALKERLGTSLNGQWMSIGQSQGGHASLGIAEFAAQDVTYQGAVATAPASSLGYIITQIAPTAIAGLEQSLSKEAAAVVYAELLSYAAYAAVGIKAADSNFDYAVMFKPRALAIAKNAEGTTGDNGLCLTDMITQYAVDIQKFLAEDSKNKVMDYPAFIDGFEKNATVAKFLQESQPGTKALKKPVYVVQGARDAAVPYQVTTALVENLNALGSSPKVILDVVEGAGHTEAIVQRNTEVVNFIKKYMPAK